MKNNLFICLLAILILSCDNNLTDPQKIIDKAIAASGGEKYLDTTIKFDFRDRHYVSTRKGGMYTYERITKDSLNTTHDFLSNDVDALGLLFESCSPLKNSGSTVSKPKNTIKELDSNLIIYHPITTADIFNFSETY